MKLEAAANAHDTQKSLMGDYLRTYEEFLGPLVDRELKLLELGLLTGGSLLMWRDYLPKATIVGLDVNPVDITDTTGRVRAYQGEQQDTTVLDRIAAETAPDGFDVIIDDASHIGQYTRIAFWHLLDNHLKPGGLYFIEDWGVSYWKKHPDAKHYRPRPPEFATHEKILNWLYRLRLVQTRPRARYLLRRVRYRLVKRSFPSHVYGMVGFVKELVDECGMEDITNRDHGLGPQQRSRIHSMRITLGHVVVIKAKPKNGDA